MSKRYWVCVWYRSCLSLQLTTHGQRQVYFDALVAGNRHGEVVTISLEGFRSIALTSVSCNKMEADIPDTDKLFQILHAIYRYNGMM